MTLLYVHRCNMCGIDILSSKEPEYILWEVTNEHVHLSAYVYAPDSGDRADLCRYCLVQVLTDWLYQLSDESTIGHKHFPTKTTIHSKGFEPPNIQPGDSSPGNSQDDSHI